MWQNSATTFIFPMEHELLGWAMIQKSCFKATNHISDRWKQERRSKLLHPNNRDDIEEALGLELDYQEQKEDFSTPPPGGAQLHRKPLDLSQFPYEDIQASDSQTIHTTRNIQIAHKRSSAKKNRVHQTRGQREKLLEKPWRNHTYQYPRPQRTPRIWSTQRST